MWLATRHGFYSIVQKNSAWHVRARRKGDLLPLVAALKIGPSEIQRWPAADYRWRIIIDRDQLDVLFVWLASSITYNNFKSEIAGLPSQREKLPAYGELWHSLAAIQQD